MIGIDRIKLTERKDLTAPEVKAWFIQRAELIGGERMEQRANSLEVRIYNDLGANNFITIRARGRYIEVAGSLSNFAFGGERLLSFGEFSERLDYIAEALEMRLKDTRVDKIEIATDIEAQGDYNSYTEVLQETPRIERTRFRGTLYFQGRGRKDRGKGRKAATRVLVVYDKGKQLRQARQGGAKIRFELRLTGGAANVGRFIGVKRLTAQDLKRGSVYSKLCKALTNEVRKVITEETARGDDMSNTDRILGAIIEEATKGKGKDITELPAVKTALDTLEKSVRSKIKKKLRAVTKTAQGSKETSKAEELREAINEAEIKSLEDCEL